MNNADFVIHACSNQNDSILFIFDYAICDKGLMANYFAISIVCKIENKKIILIGHYNHEFLFVVFKILAFSNGCHKFIYFLFD
jgi:hypothetical protein